MTSQQTPVQPFATPSVAGYPGMSNRWRRTHSRLPVHCEAWLYDPQGKPVAAGTTRDLGNGGIGLALPRGERLEQGRHVRFRMAVPRKHDRGEYIEEVYGDASIVRTDAVNVAGGESQTVGLQFDDPMPLLISSTVRGRIVPPKRTSA